MRIKQEQVKFLSQTLIKICPSGEVFLFGSRVNDKARGGDIDILWLSPRKISLEKLIKAKIQFYLRFGEQKIDLVNLPFRDNSPFKQLILAEAVKIS